MALEALVLDPTVGNGDWSYGYGFDHEEVMEKVWYENWECSPSTVLRNLKEWEITNVSSPENYNSSEQSRDREVLKMEEDMAAPTTGRRKRRRCKSMKNEEEVENQRITHIAVERNRRKQMNEYLSVLRSMMPSSYVQRGDQASIVAGTINFVKELEQFLQCLEAQNQIKKQINSNLFSNFFTFPQYSMYSNSYNVSSGTLKDIVTEKRSVIANVEVTMVESHANIKVLSKSHPKQLLKMVVRLHSLHLLILHLNVTTIDYMVLYSFSVKVEEECELTSVNEIASAVYEMVGRIQEEVELS